MSEDTGKMKHAVLIPGPESGLSDKCVETEQADGSKSYLAETEYTQVELEAFEAEGPKWILECSGSQQFTAGSDSGEDAWGHYCGYFDPIPEKAVFRDGKPVGLYLCNYGIRYSGNGRYDFDIDDWGYPGDDPFRFVPWGAKTHVFLFSDEGTHKWKDWTLLKREDGREYSSSLEF